MEDYFQKRNKYINKIKKRLEILEQTDNQFKQMGGLFGFDDGVTIDQILQDTKKIDSAILNTGRLKTVIEEKSILHGEHLKRIIMEYNKSNQKLIECLRNAEEAKQAADAAARASAAASESIGSSNIELTKRLGLLEGELRTVKDKLNDSVRNLLQLQESTLGLVGIIDNSGLESEIQKISTVRDKLSQLQQRDTRGVAQGEVRDVVQGDARRASRDASLGAANTRSP